MGGVAVLFCCGVCASPKYTCGRSIGVHSFIQHVDPNPSSPPPKKMKMEPRTVVHVVGDGEVRALHDLRVLHQLLNWLFLWVGVWGCDMCSQ